MLIINIHKAMCLIHHVLLAAASVPKHLTTEQTKVSKLDSLCNVSEQALQRGHTIDIKNVKGVPCSHMIEAFLHSTELFVTEEANSQ